ncbi:hypothetical protein M5D96_012481 [Drosophila gunungcola]|uniref:Uncharacterized protein n=1 Tax=Drosophila gunungcola TaxID=103775 RepID=A0A9P9YDJ2_9MUSC|nr:hypothetical protein M5D96_012481 [Drosophila gunungcola]
MFREFIFSRGAEHVTLPIEYKFEFKSKGNGENEKTKPKCLPDACQGICDHNNAL